MRWAKTRPAAELDLVASNMLACRLDELEGAHQALELTAKNDEGYAPLLEAIAAHYGVTPDRVMTAIGCSGANFLVAAAHLRAGDTVLIESPGYDPLPGACRLLGATVTSFERRAEDGFRLDLDAVKRALTRSTKLIIVTSPHNPSGAVLDAAALAGLQALANDTGVSVLVDEAYLDIVRLLQEDPARFPRQADPARFPRAASFSEGLISTSSLTKSYGLNGLRCGWAVVPPGMSLRLRQVRDVVDGVGSAPVDRLSALAFSQLARLGERARAHVRGNLELMREFLAGQPALETNVPVDATIVFPRLRGVESADAFCDHLFTEHGVAVLPGRFFGAPAHFRVSVAGPAEALERGLDRLGTALARRT
jgi:aspartate/methionine/tyrosine aminotransferase